VEAKHFAALRVGTGQRLDETARGESVKESTMVEANSGGGGGAKFECGRRSVKAEMRV
jgi:hypothetical protein